MTPIMALLLAGALLGAEPEERLAQVPCAFAPAFFETGTIRFAGSMDPVEHGYLEFFEAFLPATRARITLLGIALDGGSDEANRRLARRRAEAVRDYLAARGISRDRIRIVTSDPYLDEWRQWPNSTLGRAVVMDVWIAPEVLHRRMPPGGPIC